MTMRHLLTHAVQSDMESEAVLIELTTLIDESPEAVEPFIGLITEYFFVLERMSVDNVKRLFRAVFRLYAARPSTMSHKDNLITMIPLLLRSAELAVLLRMETALKLEDSPTREEDVRSTLELLDEARNSNQFVRTFCYAELAEVLRTCFGCSKCIAMHEWLTVFIEEFRSDFFTDRYELLGELEGERYLNQDSNLWLKCSDGQNLGEAIPLLEAAMEAIKLQETWPEADTIEATQRDRWSRIFYALSANICVQGVDEVSKDACDTLFRITQWIRTETSTHSNAKDLEEQRLLHTQANIARINTRSRTATQDNNDSARSSPPETIYVRTSQGEKPMTPGETSTVKGETTQLTIPDRER
ncbi:unnamed protein product [Cylicocyclus nassatus]|uniref:Uncharacterized protein n=1 Tax=Cylicocyclus nassatus TaxID=53992 RepID=A0AA36MCC4_CYLNA|nr:unnamed protein product [Cylicocyclus nassatus]